MMQSKPRPKILGVLPGQKPIRKPPSWSDGNYTINWLSCSIIFLPTLGVTAALAFGVPVDYRTLSIISLFYALIGFSVTVGYHRMYSHRAFTGHWALQLFVAFFGAGAFEGSVKWWGRNHRIHHRYIDTDLDPYNAKRGFFFSHMGWMMMNLDYEVLGHVEMGDLNANRIVRWQHDHYLPLAVTSGIVLPTLVCGLGWGDWLGGYFYAALLKMVMVHHTTFFINSLAHSPFFGADRAFSQKHTSRDSPWVALFTLGEGYHNFHHEFAQDYRNGIKWYHWDPTKWIIRFCEFVGLAHGLVRTPEAVIQRSIVNVRREKALMKLQALEANVSKLLLPDSSSLQQGAGLAWTWADVERRVAAGAKLVVVGDYVLDLSKAPPGSDDVPWYEAHPGGRKVLDMFIGKDATDTMCGIMHGHSRAAYELLPHLRVASLASSRSS